jgi:hypothetical protein
MERASNGGLIVSETTLHAIAEEELAALGVTVKRVRRQVFAPRQQGVPADLVMYRLKTRAGASGSGDTDEPDDADENPA